MKQKRLGDILYVFDVNPYEITSDTDAEVVKVQEESFAGFIEMNPSLAEKIVKYNYHTMCVNVPEWAPYVDEEDPQEQLTFGIYGSAAQASIAQVQRQNANNDILETWVAGQNLNFPFQASFNEGEHFAVEFVNGVNPDLLNITGDALSIQWQDAVTNNFWRATAALSTSTSVGIDASEPSTYKLYLQGSDINDTNLRVTINSTQVALEDLVSGIDIAQETLIEVWLLTEDINDYDVSSISTWMNESTDGGHLHYWRNMPAEDKTINISYVGTPAVTYTVDISSEPTITYIKELSEDKSTVINTYTNPSFPVSITVTENNYLAFSDGSSSESPWKTYKVSAQNVSKGSSWDDPVTGDKCGLIGKVRRNGSVSINYKRILSLTGNGINPGNLKVDIDGIQQYLNNLLSGIVVNPGSTINVWLLTENVSDYDVTSISQWMTQSTDGGLHYTGTMPDANQVIDIPYVGTPVTSYTLSLTGTGIDETNLVVRLDNQLIALTDLTNGVTAYPNQEVELWLNDFDHISYYDTSSISQWMTLEQSIPDNPYIYVGSMPAANTVIDISYIVPVTLNVSMYDNTNLPGDQGISSVEIGSLTITDDAPNYDLSNENYTNNVTVNPGTTTVKFYSANGPITSINMIKIVIDGFEYMATPSTDPVSGTPIMTPGNQYSVIDYDTNPASGNPWVSILIPTLNQNQEPFENNDQLKLYVAASGS